MKKDLRVVPTLKKLLPWLWLAGCFIVLVAYLDRNLPHLLDSDLSSELLMAREIVESGRFVFAPTWIYSTQIKVLETQLVYALLFRLTDNWHLIHVLASVISYVIMLACYYYFCVQMDMKKAFPLTAGCLMLPFSECYFFYVLRGVYYIPYISASFMLFALTIKSARDRSPAAMLWLALLSLVTGMSGLRQMLVFSIPMTLAALVMLYLSVRDRLPQLSETIRLKELKSYWAANVNLRLFLISAGSAVAVMAGIVINSKVLAAAYQYRSYGTIMKWTTPNAYRVELAVDSFLFSLGFRDDRPMLSGAAICNAIVAIVILILIVCSIRVLRRFKTEAFERTAVVMFNLFGALAIGAVAVFSTMSYFNHYPLPVVVFALPIIAIYLSELRLSPRWVSAYRAVLCAMCLLMGVRCYAFYVYEDNRNAREQQVIAEFLTDNGYSGGYAGFWNGNVLTDMSNGALDIWVLDPTADDLSEIYLWLQSRSHIDTHPEGKIFFVTNYAEQESMPTLKYLAEDHIIFDTEHFLVYGYGSYDELPEEMRIHRVAESVPE